MKKFALIAVATVAITTSTAQEDDIQHILSRQLSRYKASGSRRKKVKEKLEQLKEDTKKPSSSANWYSQKKIEWWNSPEISTTTTSGDSKTVSQKNEWWNSSPDPESTSEDDWNKNAWWNGSGKSGKSGSSWWQSGSKSNKTPKSTWSDTTWHSGDDWKSHHDKEEFFLVPYICPRKCVEYVPDDTTSSDTTSSSLGNVAVQDCNLYDDHQKWYVSYHEQFMKFEASDEKGSCIGIGDGDSVEAVCGASDPPQLKMVDCEDERTDWYFTGGQYISGYCWIRGYSAAMNVELDGDDVTDECKDFLKVIPELFPSSPSTSPSITTFMVVGKKYLDSIPAPSAAPSVSSMPSVSSKPTK